MSLRRNGKCQKLENKQTGDQKISRVRAFSSGKLICAVTLLRYEELRCAIVVQFLNCTNVAPCALGHSF